MRCTACNIDKPLTEFYNDKKSQTGKTTRCKSCILKQVKGSNNYPPTRRLPYNPKCKNCGVELPVGRRNGLCTECRENLLLSRKIHRQLICKVCGKEIIGKKQARFCEDCKKERSIQRSKTNGLKYARNSRINNPKRAWARGTINSHSKKFIIKLTIDELENYVNKINTCEICEKPINWMNHVTKHDSPTLDRINNENELTTTNIQLLCHECNSTKRERSMKQFIEYCYGVTKKYKPHSINIEKTFK